MSKISGIRDVDREIIGKLEDFEILNACSINKYTWNIVCDDQFLRRRLITKYPEIEKEKMKNESWKRFFLRAVNYIKLMKQEFNYEYTFGNINKQYKILKDYRGSNDLLLNSSKRGELALVIWSLNIGANVHAEYNRALIGASKNGHLETVKYLVEAGANIHAQDNEALRLASENGQLETVKYLVEAGADIHAKDNYALRMASLFGKLEVIKYLKKK
jgi:hypothetical protein